ncbi:gp53-like domain-containing protein [Pantoea allii]|uniref:gp53-like domain-containing protein n=1 Tax=Pantoea allii TaxID=574096 RepID=UPI003D319F45
MNLNDAPKKQPVPFAVNGQREDLLPTTPAGDNTASYDAGFPPVTMILKAAGGRPPKGQDINQILYELSNLARWSSAGALNKFDSSFSTSIGGYPKGATIIGDDGSSFYQSTIDNNTNNPNSSTTGWKNLTTQYLLRQNPFADIKSDGAASVATALSNLGISVQQTGSAPLIIQVGKFILQAGISSGTTTSEGNLNVNFPVSFPNAVMFMNMSQANTTYAGDTNPLIFSPYPSPSGPVSALGAQVRNSKTGSAQTSTFVSARFIAVGF